jgi:bifunctional NMN adenylyltransferase/nudix hydrolase
MSHDRGCPCGRESYEYADCTDKTCNKKPKQTKRDALVFIGRFQPFHNGHKAVIDVALEQAKEVVVVVGSSFAARNIRNPFTFEERKAMIEAVYTDESRDMFNTFGTNQGGKTLHIVPVSDYPYDDNKWINAVQSIVDETVPHAKDVGLIGHSKDSTSYYLNIFPKWKNHVEVENVRNINATDIRIKWFENSDVVFGHKDLPEVVSDWMWAIGSGVSRISQGFDVLRQEYQMVKKYKEAWKNAPFPPTFMTVDAVVVQSGHVLLVKRGDMPGKGLWALPGGFLNQDETMLDGAIRELKEETKIKLPDRMFESMKRLGIPSKTFDAPNRSARGRTITQAFFIDLGVGELPKVKGSDDAEKAFWMPLNEVGKQRDRFFEDHLAIIDYFVPVL